MKSDYSFDDVIREVSHLRPAFWDRLAFAATCAERLLPFYLCFSAQQDLDTDPYFSALNYVWRCLEAMEHNENMVQQMLAECEKKLPSEDDAWQTGCPYAEDASAAILYCLRFLLSGDQQEVIWAAKRAYEAADNFVVSGTNHNIGSREDELDILRHPIIQNELARQLRDLQELQHTSTDILAFQGLCRNLRQRAKKDSINFFGSSSNSL